MVGGVFTSMLLEEVSVRNLILYFAAACGYVPRKYMRVFSRAPAYPSSALRSAVRSGLVTVNPLLERISYRDKKDEYIQLTMDGFKYLSENAQYLPPELRWVREIYDTARFCKIVRENSVNDNAKMRRYLSVVGATIFSAASGCKVSTSFPKPREEKKEEREAQNLSWYDNGVDFELDLDNKLLGNGMVGPSQQSVLPRRTQAEIIREIIETKKEPEQNRNGVIFNHDADIIFTNSFEMKRLISSTRIDSEAFSSGRFTGVAESPLKSVLMYEGRRTGFSWSKWQTEYDMKPYRIFTMGKSKYRNFRLGEEYGAMLVSNAKMFEDLMHDKADRRKPGELFAQGFSSFIFFPINHVGTVQFSAYMNTDMKSYYLAVAENAVFSGYYQHNSGRYPTLFPLISNAGMPITIGTYIDAVRIQRILALIKEAPFQFGVVCYEWQSDYYRRVFPDSTEFLLVQ